MPCDEECRYHTRRVLRCESHEKFPLENKNSPIYIAPRQIKTTINMKWPRREEVQKAASITCKLACIRITKNMLYMPKNSHNFLFLFFRSTLLSPQPASHAVKLRENERKNYAKNSNFCRRWQSSESVNCRYICLIIRTNERVSEVIKTRWWAFDGVRDLISSELTQCSTTPSPRITKSGMRYLSRQPRVR